LCTRLNLPSLACWQLLDACQVPISRTRTQIISVIEPRLSLCLCCIPFLISSFFSLPIRSQLLFCSKGEKGKNPEAKNDIKPPESLHRDYCLKMPALPEPSLPFPVPEISLPRFLSPNLPLIFFQLRGADSPDTIIQLYCGTATVAAVLCKGFPRMARGQSWVSRRGGAAERYKQRR